MASPAALTQRALADKGRLPRVLLLTNIAAVFVLVGVLVRQGSCAAAAPPAAVHLHLAASAAPHPAAFPLAAAGRQATPGAAYHTAGEGLLPRRWQRPTPRESAAELRANYSARCPREVPAAAAGEPAAGGGRPAPDWPRYLCSNERKVYSKDGEDGILEWIFSNIGTTNKYYVEFGTEQDARECNSRLLRERGGWQGLLMDGGHENEGLNLHKEFITPQNINQLLDKYKVPEAFDLLSIDVDYDDYFVWKALEPRWKPRVVIVEYNSGIPLEHRWVADPADSRRWSQNDYFGASLRALADLGRAKGYSLLGCTLSGVNAFFVRSEVLEEQGVKAPSILDVYVGMHLHPPNSDRSRLWVELDEDGNQVARLYQDLSQVREAYVWW